MAPFIGCPVSTDVWRIRVKIIGTVQCCTVHHNCTQLSTATYLYALIEKKTPEQNEKKHNDSFTRITCFSEMSCPSKSSSFLHPADQSIKTDFDGESTTKLSRAASSLNLFHDRLRAPISHYSVWSVISTHKLTPLKRDHVDHAMHAQFLLITFCRRLSTSL